MARPGWSVTPSTGEGVRAGALLAERTVVQGGVSRATPLPTWFEGLGGARRGPGSVGDERGPVPLECEPPAHFVPLVVAGREAVVEVDEHA